MIVDALQGSLNPDPNVRQKAEHMLSELVKNPDTMRQLAEILVSPLDLGIRKLSAITLKSVPLPEVHMDYIKQALIASLNDLSICAVSAAIISNIEWPEQWPDLLHIMVSTRSPGSLLGIHELVKDNLVENNYEELSQIIFPFVQTMYLEYPEQCLNIIKEFVIIGSSIQADLSGVKTLLSFTIDQGVQKSQVYEIASLLDREYKNSIFAYAVRDLQGPVDQVTLVTDFIHDAWDHDSVNLKKYLDAIVLKIIQIAEKEEDYDEEELLDILEETETGEQYLSVRLLSIVKLDNEEKVLELLKSAMNPDPKRVAAVLSLLMQFAHVPGIGNVDEVLTYAQTVQQSLNLQCMLVLFIGKVIRYSQKMFDYVLKSLDGNLPLQICGLRAMQQCLPYTGKQFQKQMINLSINLLQTHPNSFFIRVMQSAIEVCPAECVGLLNPLMSIESESLQLAAIEAILSFEQHHFLAINFNFCNRFHVLVFHEISKKKFDFNLCQKWSDCLLDAALMPNTVDYVQTVQQCIATLVPHLPNQKLCVFVEKMMNADDQTALYIGDIVSQLKLNNVEQIIKGLCSRLHNTKNLLFAERLTLCIVRLTSSCDIISMLQQLNALEMVFLQWLDIHGQLMDKADLDLSVRGFCFLLQSQDQRLMFPAPSIMQSSRRVTRSVSKQTAIPFLAKVLQLLIADAAQVECNSSASASSFLPDHIALTLRSTNIDYLLPYLTQEEKIILTKIL